MNRRDNWRQARFTLGIAAVTVAAWLILYASRVSADAASWRGFMPARLGADGDYLHLLIGPLTAALVHRDFVHLAVDMAFLIVCGRIVETIVGGPGLLFLYLAGAYAAAGAFYLTVADEAAIFVGSGGAVGAVVGAYAMLAGRLRAKARSQAMARAINIAWLAVTWIVFQALLAATVPFEGMATLVASLSACAGGFVAGLLLAKPLLLWKWRGA
jgi:membrane associated rhomboid family serine protease